MRPNPLARRLVIPALLVALVGWLAALEYHWLDEVSQADRDRRHASLQQHASDFADDFDRELARVYVLLSSAGPSIAPASDAAFARRYDAWHEAASDPQMVRAIYRVSPAPNGAAIRQFDPATRTFRGADWPPALSPLREQLDRSSRPAGALDTAFGLAISPAWRDTVNPDVPAIIASALASPPALPAGVHTFVALTKSPDLLIAYLDRSYIQTTLLPALAARYFPASGADVYRLAVIDPKHSDAPVMTSNWPAGTPVDPARADASEPLFDLRADVTAQILQRTVLKVTPFVVQRDRLNNPPLWTEARSTESAVPGTLGPLGNATESTTLQVAVQGQSDDAKPVSGGGAGTAGRDGTPRAPAAPSLNTVRLTTHAGAGWRLVLQHASGSLDAAVNRARARNLWLSFGLLAVLASGVVLIVTNAQRSERLARQQMEFVATVSHELRTPLAVIRSAAQNLSAGVVDGAARARQYGELIDAEGRRLTEMVEQVLDYAGIGGRQLDDSARPVDLGQVAADVVESCAPLARTAGVTIETGIAAALPAVSGHAQALRSAVQNLVINALKYGADGGWIGVTVRAGHADGRPAVVVTVRDRGLGIDPQDRRHLFEPFYRGRRAIDAQVRGNGLGLSLVKRIVETHGGRVAVAPEPGPGAVFTLTMPAAAATAAESSLAVDAGLSAE